MYFSFLIIQKTYMDQFKWLWKRNVKKRFFTEFLFIVFLEFSLDLHHCYRIIANLLVFDVCVWAGGYACVLVCCRYHRYQCMTPMTNYVSIAEANLVRTKLSKIINQYNVYFLPLRITTSKKKYICLCIN